MSEQIILPANTTKLTLNGKDALGVQGWQFSTTNHLSFSYELGANLPTITPLGGFECTGTITIRSSNKFLDERALDTPINSQSFNMVISLGSQSNDKEITRIMFDTCRLDGKTMEVDKTGVFVTHYRFLSTQVRQEYSA